MFDHRELAVQKFRFDTKTYTSKSSNLDIIAGTR